MDELGYILLWLCCFMLSLINLCLWIRVNSLERRLDNFLLICKKQLDRIKERYNV